jgi:hypothetical protein
VVQKLKTLPCLNPGWHPPGEPPQIMCPAVNGNMFGNFIKCRD